LRMIFLIIINNSFNESDFGKKAYYET
jgi:hypothetical protein